MKIVVSIIAVALIIAYLVVRSRSSHHSKVEEVDVLPDAQRLSDLRDQNARMTPEQILARSREDLRTKTSAHSAVWHLGSEDRWDFNQTDGTLIFTFSDTIVVTRAQLIGSYVYSSRSWLWSWGNDHVDESLKHDAEIVRTHMIDRKLPKSGEPELFVDESDAWDFTSLACYLADAQGGYSGRDGDMRAFFTFHSPEIRKR